MKKFILKFYELTIIFHQKKIALFLKSIPFLILS